MYSELTTTLLQWFGTHGRDLPWRHTTDPYAIWLSEVILQQTRIQQGLAYWQRFMQQFPTAEALAAASEDEVLRLWQGLGYYSRARNLHAAAKQIVALGRFPDTLEGIRALKGVGDYTAAAIASIAYGLPAAVVDGNVYRVLSRYYGIDTPINSSEGRRTFAALAQSLLPPHDAGTFNQAIMDFGAIHCTPRSPRCADCPLADGCDAFRTDRIAVLPVKLRRTAVKTRRFTYIYVRCQRHIALRRRPSGDIWQGLWEPLLIEHDTPDAPVTLPCGTNGERPQLLRSGVRHVLTHRIILADFYVWEPTDRPSLPPDYTWIPESSLDSHALPRLIEILLQSLPADAD